MRAVLEAARAEFLARGYRKATMDDIASRAGVSKRTLYLWHRDKATLFQTCIVEGTMDLRLPSLDSSLDLATALTTYGAVLLPAVSTDYSLNMSRLLFREGPEFAEVREAIITGARLISQPVADLLAAKGFVQAEAEQLAELFMVATLAGVQKAVVEGGPPPDLTDSMRRLGLVVRLFANGLRGWGEERGAAGPDASSAFSYVWS